MSIILLQQYSFSEMCHGKHYLNRRIKDSQQLSKSRCTGRIQHLAGSGRTIGQGKYQKYSFVFHRNGRRTDEATNMTSPVQTIRALLFINNQT